MKKIRLVLLPPTLKPGRGVNPNYSAVAAAAAGTAGIKAGDRFASNWGDKRQGEWWFLTVKSVSGKSATVVYDTGSQSTYTLTYLSRCIRLPASVRKSKSHFTREQVTAIVEKAKANAQQPESGEVKHPVASHEELLKRHPDLEWRKHLLPRPTSANHSLVDDRTVMMLNRVSHEDGAGYNGNKVGDAVRAVMDGHPSLLDIRTMIQTNNYGGPVSTYRNDIPKSQQRQQDVDLIKAATVKARQMAKGVRDTEAKSLLADASKLLTTITDKDFDDMKSEMRSYKWKDDEIERALTETKEAMKDPKPQDLAEDGKLRLLGLYLPKGHPSAPDFDKFRNRATQLAALTRNIGRKDEHSY